eukprot:gene346-3710_t
MAREVLQYRVARQDTAAQNARKNNFDGLMFPWESAFTGSEVDPAPETKIEEHIQGDIVLAFYQHWLLTRDVIWLKNAAFPVIEGVAQFWASKAVKNNDSSYSINDIMGPDEYHGPVNNSVYCNVIAQLSLKLAYDLAPLAGRTQNETFIHIAENLVILFDKENQYHPEFQGYDGAKVKQADVILLGYPLNFNMSKTIRRNDLEFYAKVTDQNGPAMTWSMFSIGYLDIGLDDIAESSLLAGGSGAQNFITGAGGFLQCVWAGYGGIRLESDRLQLSNPRPLPGTKSLTIDQFHYLNHTLSLSVQSNRTWSLVDTTRT